MRHKLHNFMDKMQQKPVAERQRLLVVSTVVLGGMVMVVGLWNISSNLVAMGNHGNADSALAQNSDVGSAPSVADKLRTEAASVWGSVQGGLQSLNDKLGPNE